MRLLSLASALLIAPLAAAQTVDPVPVKLNVFVDGKRVSFPEQGPVVVGQRVYVPARGVFERMGATVAYNRSRRVVTATTALRTIDLPLDSPRGRVDGRAMRLAERPVVMNDHLLVPLRLLSESLCANVEWDAERMTVRIQTK